jgi:hypothetical protein
MNFNTIEKSEKNIANPVLIIFNLLQKKLDSQQLQ